MHALCLMVLCSNNNNLLHPSVWNAMIHYTRGGQYFSRPQAEGNIPHQGKGSWYSIYVLKGAIIYLFYSSLKWTWRGSRSANSELG